MEWLKPICVENVKSHLGGFIGTKKGVVLGGTFKGALQKNLLIDRSRWFGVSPVNSGHFQKGRKCSQRKYTRGKSAFLSFFGKTHDWGKSRWSRIRYGDPWDCLEVSSTAMMTTTRGPNDSR